MSIPRVVIEVIGEGKTDIGEIDKTGKGKPEPPTFGVVPVLLHTLCNAPSSLFVVRKRLPFLQKGTLARRVEFSKRQAFYNKASAVVFVVDTEGASPEKTRAELGAGRDARLVDFPTAVGVAHPCIEAWLLADAGAIARGLKLSQSPTVPDDPENLPAPQKNRDHNPKTILSQCAGSTKPLSASHTTNIARQMTDIPLVEARCPRSFKPFADEVRAQLAGLF